MSSVPEWIAKWEHQQSANEPRRVPKEQLVRILKAAPQSVAVVDLRNDQEKGYITQAVHCPATVVEGPADVQEKLLGPILAQNPATETIVVHCNSSGRRASLVGGWAKDHVEKYGPAGVRVEILHEGIVGWLGSDDPEIRSETTLV